MELSRNQLLFTGEHNYAKDGLEGAFSGARHVFLLSQAENLNMKTGNMDTALRNVSVHTPPQETAPCRNK
jgi:hypothetical protein